MSIQQNVDPDSSMHNVGRSAVILQFDAPLVQATMVLYLSLACLSGLAKNPFCLVPCVAVSNRILIN